MTFEQIKALIDIVCQKGLHELEVERSDFRVKIVGSAPASQAPVAMAAAPVSAPPASSGERSTTETATEAPLAKGHHSIVSPIVGTFYGSPSPDSDPYVQVGDRVRIGQVLCIIEAMKLMNEIESDADGEIVEILPGNAQPVEFGEPLFVIRVDS